MEEKNIDIEVVRHSLSHILAAAVLKMFPEAKLGIGPAIENGFYYDFGLPRALAPEDLGAIEKEMRRIITGGELFDKTEEPVAEMRKKYQAAHQDYKVELLDDIQKEGGTNATLYRLGDFDDLCKGPHIASAKELANIGFKLDKIAGAYWRGDEKRPMLQRVYGLAFPSAQALKDFLRQREEAEKRDHRKLGAELDLFSFHEEAPGMPFWHDKGRVIFDLLVEHWHTVQAKYGYLEVRFPNLLDVRLWKQSGHYEHYKNNMFFVESGEKKMALRPMDCPGAILYYKEKLHSYQELPLRLSELGTVFRDEKSGELHGLMRVQQITQDDAHVFVTQDQIKSEVVQILAILEELYKPFGMEYKVYLSTKPDDAAGDAKIWARAEKALAEALEKNGVKYDLKEKDGAFYGPKIDIEIKDSLGRSWQTGTVQLDFFMPENFGLEYIGQNGKAERPIIIHRALMGSLERFIGVLLEHTAAALPLWLSPVQARIITVSEKFDDYARKVKKGLEGAGVRVELDISSDTLGKKIRDGELNKVPYLLIVGEKESSAQTVAVRQRGRGDIGATKVNEFLQDIKNELKASFQVGFD